MIAGLRMAAANAEQNKKYDSHFLDDASGPESELPDPGPDVERLKNRLLGDDGVPSRD